MKLIASETFPATADPMDVTPGFSGQDDLYLFDSAAGKIQKINWQTGERTNWGTLDPSGCSPLEPHILSVAAIRQSEQLIIQNCGRIELLDKNSLKPIREIANSERHTLHGFNLSPSEKFLVVTAKVERKQSLLVFRTSDWTNVREWDLDDGQIAPDDRTLVTTFARRKNPASLAADECGFRSYDVNSIRAISEFVRSATENDDVCPDYPGPFVPGQPHFIITTDSLRGGISEWDWTKGLLIQHLVSKVQSTGPPQSVESLSVSSNGQLAAVVTSRREWGLEWGLTIWDLPKGEAVYEVPLGRHPDPILRARFYETVNKLILVHSNRLEIFEYQLAR